jgi:2',3'-cyclic-nucleotide 2'-phosphodiesterase
MRILAVGDVVGKPGRQAVHSIVPALRAELQLDLVIANGENSAGGRGLTAATAEELLRSGVDVITSGNHIWQKREIYETLESNPRVLRPANYPQGTPGNGHVVLEKSGVKFAVINLQGREDMTPINDPFRAASDIVKKLRSENAIVIIDFHAESTEEKEALAFHLDGEVAAIVGTHTHVQTADERILPKGTGYITDIGMTGPEPSVIGVKTEIAIRRSMTQMPIKMETSEEPAGIHGVLFTIDIASRKAIGVKRIAEKSVI